MSFHKHLGQVDSAGQHAPHHVLIDIIAIFKSKLLCDWALATLGIHANLCDKLKIAKLRVLDTLPRELSSPQVGWSWATCSVLRSPIPGALMR